MTFCVPEKYRVCAGGRISTKADGNNGQFAIRSIKLARPLFVQASDAQGWEHVSVSLPDRCPTWAETSFVKGLFWYEDDLVVQFHPVPPYVNDHEFVLHLWRKAGSNTFCETPPCVLV